MPLRRFLCARLRFLLLALFLPLLAVSARGAYSLTTGMLNGADEDVSESSPTNATGNRAFLEFRSRLISGTERHTIAVLRFDLTGLQTPIDAATLRLWIASTQLDSDAFAIDVFGLVDGTAGETTWSPATLSYNNTPGLTGGDIPNIDRDHASGATVLLGSINYPGSNFTGGVSLTSQALVDFLNADTNDSVTLILEPQVATTGQDFFLHLRTAEGIGTTPGDFAPTIDMPNAYEPGTEPPPPPSSLILAETASDVTLGNGLVRAVINKSSGNVTDLRLEGGNNLLLNGGRLYLDSNSGGSYYGFGGTYALVESTATRAHVKLTGRMGEFTAEHHFVLQSGASGLHTYTIFRHGVGDAATYLEQARTVLRVDKNVFTQAFSSENKTGQMVHPDLLVSAPTIMDATQVLPASSSYTTPTGLSDTGLPVYSKYDWADYLENHTVHGLAGDTVGLWMINGSEEFMNGGPTKAELFDHGTNTTPLMIRTFQAAHFLGSGANVQLAADQVWEKLYGPYFVYVNSGASTQAVWDDARARAAAEKAAWPLSWMNEPAYPLARGTVTGTLLAGGLPAANALVVLAKPGSDWQLQGADYLFWSRADAQGTFSIGKVRPGNYAVRAVVPGFSGEAPLGTITVNAGATTDLGALAWTPPARTTTLWQLGTPDRSTEEFRFGGLMRQYGLWWRYLEERGASDLTYTIGTGLPSDWYYAQMVAPLDDGTMVSPKWHIVFNLVSLPSGTCELVFDFAGAMSSTLNLTLNGSSLGSLTTANDAGIYRSATRSSRYSQQRVTFDATRLQLGANTLTLQLNGGGTWTGTKAALPRAGVMYDAIRLEAGTQVPEAVTAAYALQVSSGPGGTASGSGLFPSGWTATLTATANAGYRFLRWSDGSTEATRSVTVTAAANYAAEFTLTPQAAFDAWAVANLPAGPRTFEGDANGNGVADGFEFAFGTLADPAQVLQVTSPAGTPRATLLPTLTANGTAHTTLTVEATRTLLDWNAGAVPLQTGLVEGRQRWWPATSEPVLFFRAVLTLKP